MRECKYSGDYNDPLLAELYDLSETYTDDIGLLRSLIGDTGPLNILECFSGTGRILVPLLLDGHAVTGIEISEAMQARAREKVIETGERARSRARLLVQDVLDGNWGAGYDLVVFGANAFYELPSAQSQEKCIRLAAEALKPNGLVFIDNDDYKGDWGKGPFGEERIIFEGGGSDGSFGRAAMTCLGFDDKENILHMARTWYKRDPDGNESMDEYKCWKHPVSADEIRGWLDTYDFDILNIFGDRSGTLYMPESERAIFWAKKSIG